MASSVEEYIALQQAVDRVYGTDTWLSVVGTDTYNSVGFAELMEGIEGVSVNYAKDGSILGYNYNIPTNTAVYNPASIANSNITSTALKTNVSVPANTVVNSSGKVVAESGLKTVSSGSTVTATLGKVAVGVGAVAAGVQLGAVIDGALYNANPNFWDSQGMSAINPQTWDSVCSTQGGKDVFNMVFGIDKNTGETQAYMDENAFAQIAQYLAVMGAFSKYTLNDYNIDVSGYSTVGKVYGYKVPKVSDLNDETIMSSGLRLTVAGATTQIYVGTLLNSEIFCVPYYREMNPTQYGYDCSPLLCSKQSISRTQEAHTKILFYNVSSGTKYYDAPNGAFTNATYLNEVVNYLALNRNIDANIASDIYGVSSRQSSDNGTNYKQLALSVLYGDSHSEIIGGIDGINDQQGATTPSGIDGNMTTAQVLARLQELYPNLFDRAITNEVVQPDGSTELFTYVPVGFPDDVTKPTPTSELQPTGGTNTTQASDTITENSPESLLQTFLNIFTTPDPYEPTEKPNPDDYPDTGDGVTPTPVIPTGSASALYSIYNPSQAELNSFGAWLWSNDFVDQLKKIFNDPMQAIIGLHKIFATPATSGTGTIKVGYLNSNVSANLVSNQYTTIDCGTVNLYEYFGNSLDYTQTEVYIYLPFVGIVRLNTDDIMRGAINVVYKVDVLTGACLCTVNVTRDLSGGQLYTYSGNCAVQYPLSSGSYMGIVSGLLGIAGSVVGTVATGGAMLPLALGVGASAIGGMKTRVEHSGSISGNAGAMGIKTPYLIIRRPQTAIADNFRIYDGASQNKYVSIGSLGGYVRARYVNLENISEATGEELKAIEDELKNGILI